jgi:predicted DNA-binding transcriptional regulator YafY
MGMTKYDRLLYIINLLRSRRTLNAARLAEECGVTERSIYRDIISLSEANIPIYYDNGYKLASDNFLPPLNFSFEEYSCLKLALESTPLELTGKYVSILKQVQAKIEAGLSQATKERRKTSSESVRLEIESTLPRGTIERWFGQIEAAINDNRCLEMDYDTIEHGVLRRVAEPYFIVFRGHAFYFVGYCRLRQNFRTFRIDRVKRLTVTEERFTRRKGISAATYFDGSWRLYGGEPVEVVVRFSGNAARVVVSSTYHPRERVETGDNGTIIYTVTVNGTAEIARWVLGFGAEAEVLGPEGLREEFQAIGRKMEQIHSGRATI